MQERVERSRRMAVRARANGQTLVAEKYETRARETADSAAVLRDLVQGSSGLSSVDEAAAAMLASKSKRSGKRCI